MMRLNDEVRDHALKAYFHYCKERHAKAFIEWRVQQAQLAKVPEKKKALRLRRLHNFHKYDKEESIFDLYMANYNDFDSVKSELMRMELEIQAERNVPL